MAVGFFSRPRPRLFGHRGASGEAPENTLEAYRRAIEDGAGYLELDVHATRDGHVVAIHDDTVDRTTDGSGEVRGFTLEELRRLDAGSRFEKDGAHPHRGRGVVVPTLEEILDAFPTVPLNVEVKQKEPAIEEVVVRALEARGRLDDVVLAAEDDAVMKRLHAAAPAGWFSFSADEAMGLWQTILSDELARYRPPGHALQIPPRFAGVEVVTPESVAAIHALGVEIHVWTIDEPDEMERLLALGVDGLMSNFPARLVRVAAARG